MPITVDVHKIITQSIAIYYTLGDVRPLPPPLLSESLSPCRRFSNSESSVVISYWLFLQIRSHSHNIDPRVDIRTLYTVLSQSGTTKIDSTEILI